MIEPTLILLLGLVLLLGGGDLLVRGASGMARSLGISPLVIGLTVVAFGTSAPELAVNVIAVLDGKPDLAFGNVVGSNLANVGLILGLAALVRPLQITGQVIGREIPFMVLATLATVLLALDPLLRGGAATIDRADGLVLLLFFCVFLYAAAGEIFRRPAQDPLAQQAEEFPGPARRRGKLPVNLLLFVVGLAALVYGGDRTVAGVTVLARAFGVPEAVAALLIVAVGTSLPELATSLIAVRRGETDIAVGNVVGSNIFNLLFILGTTATIDAVPLPAGGMIDLAAALVLAVALLPIALTHQRRIVRTEGALLLLGWAGYMGWRFVQSS